MADGYVPNRELIELIQRVCKQFMNSFQPRPKRGRRVHRGGGGGKGGEISISRGRVVLAIGAATGNLSANWGQGTASVSLLDTSSGVESDPDNPINVVNPLDTGFIIDAMVWLDMSQAVPQILNGTCFEFVDWANE